MKSYRLINAPGDMLSQPVRTHTREQSDPIPTRIAACDESSVWVVIVSAQQPELLETVDPTAKSCTLEPSAPSWLFAASAKPGSVLSRPMQLT